MATFTSPLLLCYTILMSKNEVDRYLAALEEPKRRTLDALRRTILEIVPNVEQCISYGSPAFGLQGKVIAGFAAFSNHLRFLSHSGSVFRELEDAISHYKTSPGALQFPVDKPLSKALVKSLLQSERGKPSFARTVLTSSRVNVCCGATSSLGWFPLPA